MRFQSPFAGVTMKRLWANKMVAMTTFLTITLVPILLLLWWYISAL